MDSIETHTTTRTLRFHTSTRWTAEVVAWLTVNGEGERIVGQYSPHDGGGWVAHANKNASEALLNVDAETWRKVVRLVHLYV